MVRNIAAQANQISIAPPKLAIKPCRCASTA
jgi:hypothetical protein